MKKKKKKSYDGNKATVLNIVVMHEISSSSSSGSRTSSSSSSTTTTPSPGCALGRLLGNLDGATSTFLKTLVADFVGVPRGPALKTLRAAGRNIQLLELGNL
jgi:hypothetical protein